jgi:hypothetical protein
MMSLKGRVWPGMGKMDLANEEMKRTRNQRKPKSVVEKMRRASEGIEPNQLVMTPRFDVERIKGVYDDEDSPVSDEEELVRLSPPFLLLSTQTPANAYQPPPRKPTRPKRKRPEPLTEISVNVPRGRGPEASSLKVTPSVKGPKPKHRSTQDVSSDTPALLGPFRPTNDIFRDRESKEGM